MATRSHWQRFQRQRVSRRRLLGAAGLGAVGLAAAAACGGGEGGSRGTATSGEGEITKDGILHISFSEILPTLELYGATALAANYMFGFTVFDHLFYVPLDTQKVEWMLAEESENPDPEGLEFIFTLKESYFHDKAPINGRLVEAKDVKATYEAYAADVLTSGTAWHRDVMDSIEAPDERTVVIRQKEPYAWFYHPGGAGSANSSNIQPIEILDQEGYGVSFDTSRNLIGSGRFMLTENDSFTRFRSERHPGWRIPGEPYLAGITRVYIGETAQALATFRAGQIDYVALSNKREADLMKGHLGDRVEISSNISRAYHTLMLNLDKVEAFKDPEVRKAINLAINREALIQGAELDAEGGVPAGPIQPALEAFALPDDEMEEYFRHDPEEAEELLKKAAFPFDKQLTLKFPSGATGETAARAQLLKEQLGDVGISVKLLEEDLLTTWYPRSLLPGDFEMAMGTMLPWDDPHYPMSFYTTHSPLGAADDPRGRNNMAFFDDEITAAVDDAESTIEQEALIGKVQNVVRLVMEKQAPMINLYASKTYTAYQHWYKGRGNPNQGAFVLFNGRAWIDTNLRGS